MSTWQEGHGEEWKGPPPEGTAARNLFDALKGASEAAANAAEAIQALADALAAAEEPANRKALAEVYGCPEDMLQEVLRVRMADLKRREDR